MRASRTGLRFGRASFRRMFRLPAHALEIVHNYRTCEFTTMSKRGVPVTWPVTPLLCDDGRFLLFSEPRASAVAQPGALLVRGDATAADRIVTDMAITPDFERLMTERIFARQPASKLMSSWLGRTLLKPYYMRILIYVTARRIDYWPTRDFAAAPQRIEVAHVG